MSEALPVGTDTVKGVKMSFAVSIRKRYQKSATIWNSHQMTEEPSPRVTSLTNIHSRQLTSLLFCMTWWRKLIDNRRELKWFIDGKWAVDFQQLLDETKKAKKTNRSIRRSTSLTSGERFRLILTSESQMTLHDKPTAMPKQIHLRFLNVCTEMWGCLLFFDLLLFPNQLWMKMRLKLLLYTKQITLISNTFYEVKAKKHRFEGWHAIFVYQLRWDFSWCFQ